MKPIQSHSIEMLKSKFNGSIILPDASNYHRDRQVWNAMIDRRPAIILQCLQAEDVPQAIGFARKNGLAISIRGGGHNIAGSALGDDAVLIDFSQMRKVSVDAAKKIAFVEPGATLADLDRATQAHGLATPVGINSTTGIAGLTLGGGFGWLTRKYGMTIDNLLSADIVTVEGKPLRASQDENPDLFWAIRGGGGNFGLVTRFAFQLHPVGPQILAGLLVFPLAQAGQVLRSYREFVASAPVELSVWAVLRKAPPLPFLPAEVHGREVIVLAVFYCGEIEKGKPMIDALRRFGNLHGEHIGTQAYADWQQAFDPLLASGARNYWKSLNFTQLGDGALDTIQQYAATLPSPQCEIFIGLISGVSNRVPSDAMAYGHRDAKFVMNVHARWEKAADDETCIGWARSFFNAATPYASAGAYVNFMTADEGDRVAAAYGANYQRLTRIKKKYDPENILHFNQNIRPA
jgi:FAD/FMN-containing dehydrogenase